MGRRLALLGGVVAAAGLVLTGCTSDPAGQPPEPDRIEQPSGSGDNEHAHKPGAHGGIIVALGRDSYHVEAVFEKGGVVRLYTLGKDEARVQEVETQELVAFVTPGGSSEAEQVRFVAEPQPGDSAGKTSRFSATLPESLRGREVQVTINNFRIGNERFRLPFSNALANHSDLMPAIKTTDEERRLFLTPGGSYTEADIKANGNTIPAVKFAGLRPTHNSHPKPGQKVCPISETEANPKFTWVIGGSKYEFCCVPCIGEFIEKAKERPGEIKKPDDYRAK